MTGEHTYRWWVERGDERIESERPYLSVAQLDARRCAEHMGSDDVVARIESTNGRRWTLSGIDGPWVEHEPPRWSRAAAAAPMLALAGLALIVCGNFTERVVNPLSVGVDRTTAGWPLVIACTFAASGTAHYALKFGRRGLAAWKDAPSIPPRSRRRSLAIAVACVLAVLGGFGVSVAADEYTPTLKPAPGECVVTVNTETGAVTFTGCVDGTSATTTTAVTA